MVTRLCESPQTLCGLPQTLVFTSKTHILWAMKNSILLVSMATITIVISALSWHYFGSDAAGILRGKPDAVMDWLPTILRIHIGGGMLAMASGTGLWFTSRKQKRFGVHRWIGRFYGLSVLVGGVAGACIAPWSIGGTVTVFGFLGLATVWMYFTARAVVLAMKGDIAGHQRAAAFSLAVTFSALTFRMFLLIPLLTSLPFIPVYRFGSWACWIINIGLVALFLRLRTGSTNSKTLGVAPSRKNVLTKNW